MHIVHCYDSIFLLFDTIKWALFTSKIINFFFIIELIVCVVCTIYYFVWIKQIIIISIAHPIIAPTKSEKNHREKKKKKKKKKFKKKQKKKKKKKPKKKKTNKKKQKTKKNTNKNKKKVINLMMCTKCQ